VAIARRRAAASVEEPGCSSSRRAKTGALGFRALFDRSDDGLAFDFAHGEADADNVRVPPVELLAGRVDARMSVAQLAHHAAQHRVKLGARAGFCRKRPELFTEGAPVYAVKGRVVVAVVYGLPHVVKDGQMCLARLGQRRTRTGV
jgi:hypothetical protein